MEFNHGEVCPHCTARPTGSSWGEVYEDGSGRPIASDTDFECGTQELVLDSGFTIHYQSDECRARTAEQKLEQVEQDWAKDKMATQEKLKSALLRLDDVQARLDETRKSRETELAALTDCWEAEKRALQIKLERVKGDREAIIQDVRNAEANTEQFRRQAEELGKAAADEAQGRIRILENLARIRDSVRSGRPLEWAYDELLALLVQERVYEPLAQEKISGPVYMAGRLELSESTKDWLREQFAKVRPMTGEDQAEADEVRRLWREQAGSLGEGPGVKIGEVPADRAAWRAVRIVSLDGSDGGGPQSPESLATQTPENPMSPQQVIAQAIGLLKLLAWLTPFQMAHRPRQSHPAGDGPGDPGAAIARLRAGDDRGPRDLQQAGGKTGACRGRSDSDAHPPGHRTDQGGQSGAAGGPGGNLITTGSGPRDAVLGMCVWRGAGLSLRTTRPSTCIWRS
jgi:FtsZ-binding cell division protein ZapB